jgi:hypothetical protein
MNHLAENRFQIAEIWQISGNRHAAIAGLPSASRFLLNEATGRSA